MSIDDFKDLYRRNQHQHGRHFVVHQHDHPVAGLPILPLSLFKSLARFPSPFDFIQRRCVKGGHSGFKSAVCNLGRDGREGVRWVMADER